MTKPTLLRLCAAIGLLIGLVLTLLALRTPCSDPMHDREGEPDFV